jgi:hypothetical protein
LLREQRESRAKQTDYWQNFSFHLIEVKSAIKVYKSIHIFFEPTRRYISEI